MLTEKLYMIVMPVHKKILTFDEFFVPEISDASDSKTDIEMDET